MYIFRELSKVSHIFLTYSISKYEYFTQLYVYKNSINSVFYVKLCRPCGSSNLNLFKLILIHVISSSIYKYFYILNHQNSNILSRANWKRECVENNLKFSYDCFLQIPWHISLGRLYPICLSKLLFFVNKF